MRNVPHRKPCSDQAGIERDLACKHDSAHSRTQTATAPTQALKKTAHKEEGSPPRGEGENLPEILALASFDRNECQGDHTAGDLLHSHAIGRRDGGNDRRGQARGAFEAFRKLEKANRRCPSRRNLRVDETILAQALERGACGASRLDAEGSQADV